MLTLLTALLVAAPPADTVTPGHAPAAIQITLNNGGNFAPGGMVNVRVQSADDGYLIVFRVDGDGRVRVVFPLDPDADAFVRGGKEYELRGRGDRSTFLADDRGGSGMVYAAIAHDPMVVRDFALNGHWDYNAIRLRDSTTDAENDLTAIVSRMTNRAHFDYDAVGYRVQDIAEDVGGVAVVGGGYYPGLYDPFYNPRWRCLSCGWGYPGSDFVAFGYSPFYDPFLYSPWGYTSAFAFGYGYGFGYGFGFPGTRWFPVINNPRPGFPVGAGRPRPRPPIGGSGSHIVAPPSSGRPGAPAPVATRARPRPADMSVMAPRARPDERPVFRQPSQGASPGFGRTEPQGQSRPGYREPPQVYRAPPSSSSAPRSAPAAQHAPPPPASRGRSGGGHR